MLLKLLLILSINVCGSYKIVVFNPKTGYSHMNFLGKVADALVDAGHEVELGALRKGKIRLTVINI
ncbi:hypothetical protein NECAME_16509 [Necator americanus]|uniref:Glucuronosyltransferase n=1 Tax=Necator americanus TaxID=51031 RepID=W2TWJ7_NECAM|nr:hypothetical protein NECAME_16509 [Necator americanus]ETN86049.1 hypothetical protein NECAME_16509 [Necator americanus]